MNIKRVEVNVWGFFTVVFFRFFVIEALVIIFSSAVSENLSKNNTSWKESHYIKVPVFKTVNLHYKQDVATV